ncbi:uncharacterized protein LOC34623425 [Cyclospora cayetanensis]|uniref:Uncharacterized protein LOC34623425 n=1 Tax=Cyclospora cayetanensis TaxID=88456 RepID=A0A6P6RQQ3_9EIME|nr:uncharacterized protein LOC34623425 [Cyclospora cayetanensis]
MGLSLRLTPFGLEQRGLYVLQDRHDEYYEQLLPLCSNSGSSITGRRDCCCITVLLVGDQNAGKTALLYSLIAATDPRYTALSSLLPIIQAEFSNRREILTDASHPTRGDGSAASAELGQTGAATSSAHDGSQLQPAETPSDAANYAAARSGAGEQLPAAEPAAPVAAVEALVSLSRDELPFLDTDVARTATLFDAEDFDFFCLEFGLKEKNQGLWQRVKDSRYVLLHLLEFGGHQLDRMHTFSQILRSRGCCSDSNCARSDCRRDFKRPNNYCSTCDQAAAAALLLHERDAQGATAGPLDANATVAPDSTGSTRVAFAPAAVPAGEATVPETQAFHLAQSLRRSFSLAAEIPLLVYIINCSTMFVATPNDAPATEGPSMQLSVSSFLRLLLRLHACCFSHPSGGRKKHVHFACSRLTCQTAAAAKNAEAARTADSPRKSATRAVSGCCCRAFDEKESFHRALEALRAFVLFLSSETTTPAETADVTSLLSQPSEFLYSRFRSIRISHTTSNWGPFEDCWGLTACASLKAEEKLHQQCASVCFLSRILEFVWDVGASLGFCQCLRLRGVSAVRILERSSQTIQEHEQSLHAAWGPHWQLCVPSVVLLLARLISLTAEAEINKADPHVTGLVRDANRREDAGKGQVVAEREQCNSKARRATNESAPQTGDTPLKCLQQESQDKPKLQEELLTGEMGRQLVSLYSACAQQQQQRRQQQLNEVSIHLWLAHTDWRKFISDFDPVEQQQLRQMHQLQQQHFTLSTTGEVVSTGCLERDDLLLLPTAAAACSFSLLARRLVFLGACLPCCMDGGPWGPLVLQLPVDLNTEDDPVTLKLLPATLKSPLAALKQQGQTSERKTCMNLGKLLETEGEGCFAAVRLPFHPSVARLVDSMLGSYTREPLPDDFWGTMAAAPRSGAAPTVSGVAIEEAVEPNADCRTLEDALHAAAENAAMLLRQYVMKQQQKNLQDHNASDEASAEIVVLNALQVLLHLAGDAVLLHQMATSAAAAKGQQQHQQPLKESSQRTKWQCEIEGPWVFEQQIFWRASMQPPAAAQGTTSAVVDIEKARCSPPIAHVWNSSNSALQVISRMLGIYGLVCTET